MLKHRHPLLGRSQRLIFKKGSNVGGALVSELELGLLTQYLNEAKTESQKRILAILEMMLDLEGIEPPVFNSDEMFVGKNGIVEPPSAGLTEAAQAKYRLQGEIEYRKKMINDELAKYRFQPYVYTTGGSGRWGVTWRRDGDDYGNPAQMTEGIALELILNLARAKHLNRLRRCAHCKNWLYATFHHQAFCSMKCQQKQYTQSEGFKEHRRNYMRDYYRVKQSRRTKLKSRR